LARDSGNILAQRNSTNPQAFHIYNTYTDASNYERASLKWDSNLFKIGTESLGTGTARDVAIINNGNVVANFLSDRFYLGPVSDGTTAGGNARGQYAVDLQLSRTAATQVVSGAYSFAAGHSNTASGQVAFIGGGNSNIVSGIRSATLGGTLNNVSGQYSSAVGSGHKVSGASNVSIGYGNTCGNQTGCFSIGQNNISSGNNSLSLLLQAKADRFGQIAISAGNFASTGDAQQTLLTARNKTTDETPTNLYLNGSSTRITIPSGKIYAFTAKISGIKSDGTAAAFYTRKGCIKNVGGATTFVGSIETIGTDIEDSATAVAITADDTNDALDIQVTGIAAETWRWVAVIEGVEIAYGT
jgi:hypothetical protein